MQLHRSVYTFEIVYNSLHAVSFDVFCRLLILLSKSTKHNPYCPTAWVSPIVGLNCLQRSNRLCLIYVYGLFF